MVQYRDEALEMNVTRLLVVLHSEDYGHLVFDISNWNGVSPQIATRTFHFPSATPVYGENRSATLDVAIEAQNYIEVGKWVGLTPNQSINFSSGAEWQSLFYIMSGDELYSGTSLNGGAFLIHSTSEPSMSSTMMTLHCNSDDTEGIYFDVHNSGNDTLVVIENYHISMNWTDYTVVVGNISVSTLHEETSQK